ncbi:MAG: type II toxin-antitoxin system ParD family antitoxin [Rhodospirillales bacterium]|nr:type II toxin-antitoxin system ParD family antitoxin [Rhodospirillales bacterium]
MATNVHLTPELKSFARECVAAGRYNNVSEVVRTALRLLQDAEERCRNFNEMVAAVRNETDREGAHDIDTVLAEMDTSIDEASR